MAEQKLHKENDDSIHSGECDPIKLDEVHASSSKERDCTTNSSTSDEAPTDSLEPNRAHQAYGREPKHFPFDIEKDILSFHSSSYGYSTVGMPPPQQETPEGMRRPSMLLVMGKDVSLPITHLLETR